jgi:N-dimethylarginine dimethylaminohydrolase
MENGSGALRARLEGGGTPVMRAWGSNAEYGVLRDVLLGPVESFSWMEANAQFSSIVRDTQRKGVSFDKQLAMRQHREMVEAYEDAGVAVHTLDVNHDTPYQVYARDSSFMTPYGAVVCQLANPRRRGEYAEVLRFYLDNDIPIYDMVSAGNFEGGDFNMIEPGAVLVGYTGLRCEEVAARQVGGWFMDEGWDVKYAPIDGFYVHIDLMVCMLAEKLAAVGLQRHVPGRRAGHLAGARQGPERPAARPGLHRLRPRHDHVHPGRRWHPLHGPAAAPRSGLALCPLAV